MRFFRKKEKNGQNNVKEVQKRAKYLKIWETCTKFENILKKATGMHAIIARSKLLE